MSLKLTVAGVNQNQANWLSPLLTASYSTVARIIVVAVYIDYTLSLTSQHGQRRQLHPTELILFNINRLPTPLLQWHISRKSHAGFPLVMIVRITVHFSFQLGQLAERQPHSVGVSGSSPVNVVSKILERWKIATKGFMVVSCIIRCQISKVGQFWTI